MEKETLEAMIREGRSLAEIGAAVGLHESTVGYWAKKHGLEPIGKGKHAAKGGLPREALEALVAEGASIAQIAETVDRSKATVRHWLQRYGLRTQNSRGRRMSAVALAGKAAGMSIITADCPRHGSTEFVINGRGYYRCRRCRAEAVTRRRRKVKETLVREAGGACCICGYDRSMRALHFHHVDPNEKRIEINAKGIALSLDTLRQEASKCVLLCSNCHAEVEAGKQTLP